MKKVLLISYYFPPRPGIGSQRPYGLAKYFSDHGWEPLVLTAKLPGRPPAGIRVIESDYKNVVGSFKARLGFDAEMGLHQQMSIAVSKDYSYPTLKGKAIKFLKEIVAYPDEQRGWYEFALESAAAILREEKVDMILSSSSPVTCHLVARKLKEEYKISWVADLRDLWTQNHYYHKFKVVGFLERRLERKTLSIADALVTVSRPLADSLKALHMNKKVFCVTNGYDEADYVGLSVPPTRKLTLTYTGQLYNGKRDPSLLFRACGQLIDENKLSRDLLEIRIFGCREEWLKGEIEKYGLEQIVSLYNFIPRRSAIEKQLESQLLLLLLWNDKSEKGVYTGKLFEYLGARRPVIAIGGSGGVVEDLLRETKAGTYVRDIGELKKVIEEYYLEFLKCGEVKYRGNLNRDKYSYRTLAGEYAEILNDLLT